MHRAGVSRAWSRPQAPPRPPAPRRNGGGTARYSGHCHRSRSVRPRRSRGLASTRRFIVALAPQTHTDLISLSASASASSRAEPGKSWPRSVGPETIAQDRNPMPVGQPRQLVHLIRRQELRLIDRDTGERSLSVPLQRTGLQIGRRTNGVAGCDRPMREAMVP
ncbi:unnamed protein product [Acanthosepion pharaonis]|uniref:Uncharacterized protein n=1 Tax=Acanthosepion pharaonis TaxID=158019 RepID=A0A812DRL7_ACAPH|nr:unnamed protein product [Sepia pharaonis]